MSSHKMFFFTESKESWHPDRTTNTTTSSYWLNWRVLICSIWVLFAIILTSVLIWKYEFFRKKRDQNGENVEENEASLYEDETWKPSLKKIHPAWFMCFRVVAFIVLLVMLIIIGFVEGGKIFYYYTQWTFTLITIYFGLGSYLSIRGCYHDHKRASGDKVGNMEVDTEQGAPANKSSTVPHHHVRKPAGLLCYVFQILFQMNAGAVVLTDCVFWFILVPCLEIKNYSLNGLVILMHSINAVFLVGDAALNCLRFPRFRIAYFFAWTLTYVIFQWVVHACVFLWWPYPFLDLSSAYAPLWYFSVAVMHIPCYFGFSFLMKLKHRLLQKWFADTYQCVN